jgi:hypothetical protein
MLDNLDYPDDTLEYFLLVVFVEEVVKMTKLYHLADADVLFRSERKQIGH